MSLWLERNNVSLEVSRLLVTTRGETFISQHGITTNYTALLVLGKTVVYNMTVVYNKTVVGRVQQLFYI